MSESTQEHRASAATSERSSTVRCSILTISDTRTRETDDGGDLIESILTRDGHEIVRREIVRDDADAIDGHLGLALADERVQAVLTTGGTGVATRDSTIDVVRRRLDPELEGFGELFRMLSYHEVGGAAMLSRATAGVMRRRAVEGERGAGVLIFCMPGSKNAVETAMEKLIAPELSHLVWELTR